MKQKSAKPLGLALAKQKALSTFIQNNIAVQNVLDLYFIES